MTIADTLSQTDDEAITALLAEFPAFLTKVEDLGLSARPANCLKYSVIVYVGDLIQMSEAEIHRIPNVGQRSLNEIKEVLAKMGLHLGMEVTGWPPDNIHELAERFAAATRDTATHDT